MVNERHLTGGYIEERDTFQLQPYVLGKMEGGAM